MDTNIIVSDCSQFHTGGMCPNNDRIELNSKPDDSVTYLLQLAECRPQT